MRLKGELVCAMIVYVVRRSERAFFCFLAMVVWAFLVDVSGDVSIKCSICSMGGMIGVIYPQTLVPHNKDRYPYLLREVDAVPRASGSFTLWVIRERKAEIGS